MISVITPTLNRGDLISEAIESVLAQNYPNVEHIIVDGSSIDETLTVLAHYPHLKVTSEPDKGIADAMNKGIKKAHGEIIGILNSDDVYADNIFAEVAQEFIKDHNVKTVSGGALIYKKTKNGQKKVLFSFTDERETALSYQAAMLDGGSINSRFFHRDVYRNVGLFDTRYRVAGDREFLIRAAMAGIKEVQIPKIIYWYRQHPNSLTFAAIPNLEVRTEMLEVLERYIKKPSTPLTARSTAKNSHSRRTSRIIIWLLGQGQLNNALNYLVRGLEANPKWPFVFLVQTAQALKRRILILIQIG